MAGPERRLGVRGVLLAERRPRHRRRPRLQRLGAVLEEEEGDGQGAGAATGAGASAWEEGTTCAEELACGLPRYNLSALPMYRTSLCDAWMCLRPIRADR